MASYFSHTTNITSFLFRYFYFSYISLGPYSHIHIMLLFYLFHLLSLLFTFLLPDNDGSALCGSTHSLRKRGKQWPLKHNRTVSYRNTLLFTSIVFDSPDKKDNFSITCDETRIFHSLTPTHTLQHLGYRISASSARTYNFWLLEGI